VYNCDEMINHVFVTNWRFLMWCYFGAIFWKRNPHFFFSLMQIFLLFCFSGTTTDQKWRMGRVGLWRYRMTKIVLFLRRIPAIFGGIRSTTCLGESNPFHSIPLSQWHSSRSEKKMKEVFWLLRSHTKRGSHRAVLRPRACRCCKDQSFT